MFDITIVSQFILLGIFVGFISGLFGIGGGGIIVPILTVILLSLDFNEEIVVHTALGTSMAIMAITSFSSLIAQHKKQAVLWNMFKMILPSVIIGTFLSSFLATYLSSFTLAIIFSFFMFVSSIHMFFGKQPESKDRIFPFKIQFLAGSFIGAISALISVAGGMFIVPFLVAQGVNIKKAIGTSSAIGSPLALSGAIGYMINGWSFGDYESSYTLGYLYLPAILLVSIGSVFAAPFGVKVSHKLSITLLKRMFSLIPFFLSIKLIYDLF